MKALLRGGCLGLVLLVHVWRGSCTEIVDAQLVFSSAPSYPMDGFGISIYINGDRSDLYSSQSQIRPPIRMLDIRKVRFVIGAGFYRSAGHQLDLEKFNKIAVKVISEFIDLGIDGYILSIATPPEGMKRFFDAHGEVQFVENGLRPEMEDDFAIYLGEILDQIRKAGHRLPSEIGFASMPNTTVGCPYSPAQWVRVGVKVRNALDRKGFNTIGLMGPETTSIEDTMEYIRELKNPPHLQLSSFALALPVGPIATANAAENGMVSAWMASLSPSSRIIVTDQPILRTNGDELLIMEAIKKLIFDVSNFRARMWYWGQSISYSAQPGALIYESNASLSELGRVFANTWRHIPASSQASPISVVAETSGEGELGVSGVSFENKNRKFVLLANYDRRSVRLRSRPDASMRLVPNIFPSRFMLSSDAVSPDGIELKPNSICLLDVRRIEGK